jgi:hypothetical protein
LPFLNTLMKFSRRNCQGKHGKPHTCRCCLSIKRNAH